MEAVERQRNSHADELTSAPPRAQWESDAFHGVIPEPPPPRPQFFYPAFVPGTRVYFMGGWVKIVAMRWDLVHSEFQFYVKFPRKTGEWVNERSLADA